MNDTITLENLRLEVALARPGTVYTGSRFDWTGFVTQVTLDGQHTFLGDEGGGCGGAGLANEFGIEEPVGYDEAAVGEQFPKLGVGLLTRTDAGPYRFAAPCPVQPFPVQVHESPTEVRIEIEPLSCTGYAVRLFKTFRLRDNMLDVVYRLVNEGNKPIATTEYCHNFLCLDRRRLGPDYELLLPPGIQLANTPPVAVDGPRVTWTETPETAFYRRCNNPCGAAAWRLRAGRLVMREQTDFPWHRFALWGTGRVVSPEAFCRLDVAPGTEFSWARQYTFSLAD